MNAAEIKSNEDLLSYLGNGNKVKFIYFWGHRSDENGRIGKNCFSQWFEIDFKVGNIVYRSSEHYMMIEKARLFGDTETLNKMLNARHPGEVKKLGREVKNFDEAHWKEKRFDIVVRGNVAKFSQNEQLKEYLLNTGERILVEASPVDKIWGIGLATTDENVENPYRWKGLNLLGYALMQSRQKIQRSNEQA